MKVAFTYNLRLTDVRETEKEAEYDSAETVNAIAQALEAAGHEVEKVEVSSPASNLLERLEAIDPDIIFNTAEGDRGRMREAFYPALFEELGIPFTGSDAYTNAITLDKWLTKLMMQRSGVETARGLLVTVRNYEQVLERGAGLAFPVIVKPNHEGSSKGIQQDAICATPDGAAERARWVRARYGQPALVEEFLEGPEITVGIHGNGGAARVLGMMEVTAAGESAAPFVYSLEVKRNWRCDVHYHIPPRVAPGVLDAVRSYALTAYRVLGCRDLARLDFRLDADGHPCFLECNALPGLDPKNSDIVMLAEPVTTYQGLVQGVLLSAGRRLGVAVP
jgi:D-alanine-D-alanine ligase